MTAPDHTSKSFNNPLALPGASIQDTIVDSFPTKLGLSSGGFSFRVLGASAVALKRQLSLPVSRILQ